ncbi:predicted protein [Nematostella vectensis]|uniref:Uncharacterized protein n=1 Tax=Nematostella vectensis TaxID=45351 RepID=A7SYZ2_NEMVE|nr:predicted protein [Nematostella vectensis]|eukprot:XP_001623171.1 predicted protein [Nematostella vectensis]
MASMALAVLALWIVFVFADGHSLAGWQGPVKRSDYSMYDNQFFRVGDTPLDNEVTDCGLVQHQFHHGYIRLREYLERMRGCGRKGKLQNIEGIAKSTIEDLPSYYSNPQQTSQRVQPSGYQQAYREPQGPSQQNGAQRSTTRINSVFRKFGTQSLVNGLNGPLSYTTNSYATPYFRARQPQVHPNYNMGSFHFQNRQKINTSPDPQRYYTEKTAMNAHVYGVPVTAGHQMYRAHLPQTVQAKRPTFSDYYGHLATAQDPRTANPDRRVTVMSEQRRTGHVDSEIDIDDHESKSEERQETQGIDGNESEENDEGTNARIMDGSRAASASKESQEVRGEVKSGVPLMREPPQSPTPAVTTPSADLAASKFPTITNTPTATTNTPTIPEGILQAKTPTQQITISLENQGSASSQGGGLNYANPDSGLASKDEAGSANSVNQGSPSSPNGQEIDGNKDDDKLKAFLAPNSETVDKPNQTPSQQTDTTGSSVSNEPQTPSSQQTASLNSATQENSQSPNPSQKPNVAINLDVLKNKILHSSDAGFLKRMLTLIRKITHHKDFSKLAVMQKSAIMGVGKAVGKAVGQPNAVRSQIAPQPPAMQPGDYTSYGNTGTDFSSQYVNRRPPFMQPGDYTARAQTVRTAVPRHEVTKKFEIERNPYQPAPRMAYVPPYWNLQRLNYGIYNGNAP